MNAPLKLEFERVDQTIANLETVLWNYRFIRQEIELHRAKAVAPVIPSCYLDRLIPIADRLGSAARKLECATEALRVTLTKSE
jgi:hypothetical protein